MKVEMFLSGFLFLFIIITNIASVRFGNKTFSDLDSDAKLQEINNDPKKFKISIVLILIEHISIISLAVTLFIAFSPYNIILGIVWALFRIGEGLIQIYNKKNYWGLLNIARQYSGTSGAEKNALIDSGRNILKTKNSSFTFAQILFSIGTLAYSILFATYGVVPAFIGWFGIVASILYGTGAGITLVKPDFKVLWKIGGLLIFLYEIVLGGWLLLSPFFVP
ncbi:hypothetical protein LCGC14_1367770 [marine sediment metagenome]|uniref:DUF4386 domain-containing protein n=1 Tax=marine sediment metagenome TaxID=412755 RepID=A0A0F9K682_9ZZZZ|nr:MAG: hypothetical protein Lokiarch_12700 [Candidatus Lokiarchaeum sp. GC14_75]HEC38643.1 DUF4386 domain-containing protein [bacterium]